MTMAPLFWKLLAAACLVWYSTITVYIMVRGFKDIREMLRKLNKTKNSVTSDE